MDKSMYDRLVASEKRLGEIDGLLSDSSVTNDLGQFKSLSKERSVLDPIVEAFKKYKYFKKNMDDALVMTNDSDPEIALMGKEEFKNNEQEIEKIEEDLKIMLLPTDPNDGKDIIFEIKGAV